MSVDHAHTEEAERNRDRKAAALALAARREGLMPFEMRLVGGTDADASRRERIRKAVGLDRAPSVETWNRALLDLELAAFRVPGVQMCPDCDWAVLRATTISDRTVLLDPFPREDGSVYLEHGKHGRVTALIYAGGAPDRPLDEPMYRQHSRSCPSSPAARRLRVPKCTECGLPLWAPLVATDPTYTSHPSCDPRETSTQEQQP